DIGRAAVVVADRQAQQYLEEFAAQPLDDVPADVTHEISLGEIAEPPQREQPHERYRQADDRARIAVLERAVAEELREYGEAHHTDGEQHCAQHSERERATVRTQVAEQPPVGAPCVRGGRRSAAVGMRHTPALTFGPAARLCGAPAA